MPRASWRLALALALVAALAWAVHGRSLSYGYVSYDDETFITRNRLVTHMGWREAATILSGPVNHEYTPLRLIALGLERKLAADDARTGHLVNLLLHALNAALVVLVARSVGATTRAAALAGLVFAAHPLTVESVDWVSEQKG